MKGKFDRFHTLMIQNKQKMLRGGFTSLSNTANLDVT